MWNTLKNWWQRYKDRRTLQNKQIAFVAVLILFKEKPDEWNKNVESAMEVFMEAREEYHNSYKEYVKRWGKEPKLEYPHKDLIFC